MLKKGRKWKEEDAEKAAQRSASKATGEGKSKKNVLGLNRTIYKRMRDGEWKTTNLWNWKNRFTKTRLLWIMFEIFFRACARFFSEKILESTVYFRRNLISLLTKTFFVYPNKNFKIEHGTCYLIAHIIFSTSLNHSNVYEQWAMSSRRMGMVNERQTFVYHIKGALKKQEENLIG